MTKRFNVDDKVKVVGNYEEMIGMVGTVTHLTASGYCVEFPGWEGGHDGDFCDGRHDCWYMSEDWLEPYQDEEEALDKHYQTKIQPIEVMEANMTPEEFQGFCKGNIIKYVCRCGKKDNPVHEVSKIIQYANWLLSSLKGEDIVVTHTEEGGKDDSTQEETEDDC